MPQTPSIIGTGARRLAPQADLQIGGASPAAFGAGVGEALQELGHGGQQATAAVQTFQLAKAQEEDQAAEFDRQAQFVKFGADEAERLDNAAREIDGPALDFTKSFMGTFDERSKAFLEGVPVKHKSQWEAKFAALRGQVAGGALKTEFGQRDAWSKTTLDTSLTALQNGVAQNPDALDDFVQRGDALIDTSLLAKSEKEDLKAKWRGTAAVAAATGDVERDPVGALERLGGVRPVSVHLADGTTSTIETRTVKPSGQLADNIVQGLVNRGLSAAQARGVAAGIAAESANNVAAFNKEGGGKGAFGLGEWRGARLDALRARYGPNPTGSQQLDFLVSELHGGDAGGKVVLSQSDEVAVLHHYVHDFMRPSEQGAAGDMKRGLSALGRQVVAHAEATSAALRQPVPGRSYSQEDAIQELGLTADQAAEFVKTGKMPAVAAAQSDTQAAGSAAPSDLPAVDPRYAAMPLSARMQLIGAAQREIEHRAQVADVEKQQDHSDKLNSLLLDLNDGKAGHADIDAARKAGWLTDYDEVNRAEGILDAKDKSNKDLNYFNSMMGAPGFAFNHFDGDQKRAVDAGVEAMGNTPQAAFQVWQKTGILATKGAQALRGAILSTNPEQVAAAASIASNMIEHDQNAFTGVDGGDDIEKNAMLYRHYVADLGKSKEEAVQQIAARNSPEAKVKIAASADDEKKFRKQILKDSVQVDSALSDKLGGWFSVDPEFTAPEQRVAVRQDFAELAWDHYREHGDYGAARTYAYSQVQKLYGAVDGRLMKYPPTRAYPPINGSWSYVFEQAAHDIKGATGKDVKPNDVYLMPLPTATAEAFRSKRPVPYEVHYIDHVDGQAVYQVLHGKAFIADVGSVRREAAVSHQQQFQQGVHDRAALGRALDAARYRPGMRGRDY